MQKFYLLFILLSVSVIGNAQELSIYNLENLINKNSWQEVSRNFLGTKWKNTISKDRDSKYEKVHIWAYDKNHNSDKAVAWLEVLTYRSTPELILFTIFKKELFDNFQSRLKSSNYEKYNTDLKNEIVTDYYKSSKFYVELRKNNSEKNSFGDPIPRYEIYIKRLGGIYDPDNGAKKIYYDDGTLKQSYHLVNGEYNGENEFYYPNGKLNISVQFKNDVEHGQFTRYIYEEDEGEGEMFAKTTGEYYNGEENGVWEVVYVGDNEHKTINYHNYRNGMKSDPFQKAQGDSLIVGNYKMDKLHGQYKVYLDLKRKYEGGVITTDITQLELLAKGSYTDGKRTGSWWESNLSYVSEGDYFNDKKTNEWKYTFLKHENDAGKELPYSNQLFLTENFNDGQLNGLSTRYWSVKTEEYPCSEEKTQVTESDTCYRTTSQEMLLASYYKQDELDGLYEMKDKSGNIVTKGYYVNGLKDGGWVEGQIEDDSSHYRVNSKGFYSKDIKEGEWIETQIIINKSGESFTIISKGKYENDNKTGLWKTYEDELLVGALNYKDNELNGESYFAYNGTVPEEIKVFEMGKLTRLSKYNTELSTKPYVMYQVTKDEPTKTSYKKMQYLEDGYLSLEYTMDKDSDDTSFEDTEGTFFSSHFIDPWRDNEGYRNGDYLVFDADDKLLMQGEFVEDDRVGIWIAYFYDQGIQIETDFDSNGPWIDKYLEVQSGKLFSGEFIYMDKENNTKEMQSIKNGFRDGITKVYSLETGKLIKKEKYKKGALK